MPVSAVCGTILRGSPRGGVLHGYQSLWVLEARRRAPPPPQRDVRVRRVPIVLSAAEGASARSIARSVGEELGVVSVRRHRLAGPCPRAAQRSAAPGQAADHRAETDKTHLASPGRATALLALWTGPLIPEQLDDVYAHSMSGPSYNQGGGSPAPLQRPAYQRIMMPGIRLSFSATGTPGWSCCAVA